MVSCIGCTGISIYNFQFTITAIIKSPALAYTAIFLKGTCAFVLHITCYSLIAIGNH